MKFLFPAFLFALVTLTIPVIIHLFNFRRHRTVYFSNVGFLKEVKKESQRRSKIKQILILIARMLTLLFLVFAFSQPYIPVQKDTKKQSSQLVAVYIDNSFSMNALSAQGQLLEAARNKAVEICMAYPPGTKFRLFTNDLEPKHQHIFNREQFIRQVSEVQSSPNVIPLSQVYNRLAFQNTGDTENTDKNLYFISDFQRQVTDPENFAGAKIFAYFLPLSPNQVANLYIDSCWVEVPAHRINQEETIFVRIKNSSNEDYQNLPLKIYLNDSIKSITNFSVNAQNEITASLKYNNTAGGSQLGKIEISDYPFTYDNDWYISYHVEPNLKALAIFDNSSESQQGLGYISALFRNDDYIRLDEMNLQSLQISRLPEYNTIFLVNLSNFSSGFLNELVKVAQNGISIVLFPGEINNPQVNNTFLSAFNSPLIYRTDTTLQKISGIEFDNIFYRDVFKKREENAVFPEIKGHLKFAENIRSEETLLLWFQNGDKALSTVPFKNGKLWNFSFPLTEKNVSFARDVLFVPTLYNIVLSSLPNQPISYTIGENNFYTLPENGKINLNSSIEVENKTTGEKFIPEMNVTGLGTHIEFGENIKEAGHYFIENGGDMVTSVAFNYNRKESDLRYYSANELEDKLEAEGLKNALVVENAGNSFAAILDDIQHGKQLWKWCILLALVFILAEVAISRFWK